MITRLQQTYQRGDVWMARLSADAEGHEQAGYRPVVIISNNIGNNYAPVVIVAAMTTSERTGRLVPLPVHLVVKKADFEEIRTDSIVMCEQLSTLDKERLHTMIGTLPRDLVKKLNKCLKISLELNN